MHILTDYDQAHGQEILAQVVHLSLRNLKHMSGCVESNTNESIPGSINLGRLRLRLGIGSGDGSRKLGDPVEESSSRFLMIISS